MARGPDAITNESVPMMVTTYAVLSTTSEADPYTTNPPLTFSTTAFPASGAYFYGHKDDDCSPDPLNPAQIDCLRTDIQPPHDTTDPPLATGGTIIPSAGNAVNSLRGSLYCGSTGGMLGGMSLAVIVVVLLQRLFAGH